MTSDPKSKNTFGTAAYGDENWSHRLAPHQQKPGKFWNGCGIDFEWRQIKSVLMLCPDEELNAARATRLKQALFFCICQSTKAQSRSVTIRDNH